MESWLGLSIFDTVVYTIFAILLRLIGVKKTGQINPDDVKGIKWFVWAFILWGVSGLVKSVVSYIGWKNEPANQLIQAIISTANSYCFLRALSFIDLKNENEWKEFVKGITKRKILEFITVCFIIFPIVIYLSLEINHEIDNEKLSKSFEFQVIWLFDTFYSLLALVILGIVIGQAFNERGMRRFIWLKNLALILLFVFVGYKLFSGQNQDIDNPVSIYLILISQVYKISIFILILLLLYSYQIKNFKDLEIEYKEFRQTQSLTEDENNELKDMNAKLNDQIVALKQNNKDLMTEFANDPSNGDNLTKPCIEFIIYDKYMVIKLFRRLSIERTEIPFDSPELFRNLIRVAIYKKFGNKNKIISQTLQYTEENKKPLQGDLGDKFWYKDKSLILECISEKYPAFEAEFLEDYKDFPRNRIGFSIPSDNIFLPVIKIEKNSHPQEVYEKLLETYPILKRERGYRKGENTA